MQKFYLLLPEGEIVDFLIDKKNDFAQVWLISKEGDIQETKCLHVSEARAVFDNIKSKHGGCELN